MTQTEQQIEARHEQGSDQATRILELLGDPMCRTILRMTSDQPRSAEELESVCDASLSSVYRKTDELSNAGLLDERIRLSDSGKHTEFVSRIEEVTLTFAPDGDLGMSMVPTITEQEPPQQPSADQGPSDETTTQSPVSPRNG